MGRLAEPSTWRALSTVALLVFVVSFVVGGLAVPGWGWIALVLSGVAFGVELALAAARR